jgi:hypothetical protein
VSVKDDLLEDFPHIYPGLARQEVERLLTLLDKGASTEGNLSLSIATALKPLAQQVAARLESYGQSGDADEYLRILRGSLVLLLQEWQEGEQPPDPMNIAKSIEVVEAEG